MYEELFHSPNRPFRATPDAKFYFAHDSVESARQTVVRAVMRAEGPSMVLGGAGLGKTLLSLVIAEDLAAKFDTLRLHAAQLCTRRALLQSILFELDLPYRNLSEGDLRLSILARLQPNPQTAPDGLVIIIDEAHTLPAKLLDELRLITNFTFQNQPRAHLVLIGGLRLEHTFAEPRMESFNQRLAARCYLQPMNRHQTRDYVRHQLSVAGVKPGEIITEDALQNVYAASEGVPRLANQILDHALVLAISRGQCPVSSALIEEAWADLQQLPAPWHTTENWQASSPASSDTIEFGALEDDESDLSDVNGNGLAELTAAVSCAHCGLEYCADNIDGTCGRPADAACSLDLERTCSEVMASQAQGHYNPRAVKPAEQTVDPPIPESMGSEPSRPNFFAAFAIPEEADSTLPGFEGNPDTSLVAGELDRTETVDSVQLAAEECDLVRPRVVLDEPRSVASHQGNPFVEAEQPALRIDSFFAARPTDEKLLALEDEQSQYDSMGLWENDPPLSGLQTAETTDSDCLGNAILADSQARQEATSASAGSLFGDDFSEEFTIDTHAGLPHSPRVDNLVNAAFVTNGEEAAGFPRTETEKDTSASNARDEYQQTSVDPSAEQELAEDAADYVARIQEFSNAINTQGEPLTTVDEVLQSGLGPEATTDAYTGSWSLNVVNTDVGDELAVQHEIEDIVSQLNFAAFSVEPYSVEQIVMPPDDRPAVPEDSVRSGSKDEIYTLHRPRELAEAEDVSDLTHTQAEVDDDRDLLVIEEQVSSAAANGISETNRPATKTAPYSQLFAKLRK